MSETPGFLRTFLAHDLQVMDHRDIADQLDQSERQLLSERGLVDVPLWRAEYEAEYLPTGSLRYARFYLPASLSQQDAHAAATSRISEVCPTPAWVLRKLGVWAYPTSHQPQFFDEETGSWHDPVGRAPAITRRPVAAPFTPDPDRVNPFAIQKRVPLERPRIYELPDDLDDGPDDDEERPFLEIP